MKIQRVNLSPLFVKLVLTTYNSATNGQYSIEPAPPNATNRVPFNSGFGAYFLKGTTLKLYTAATNLDSSQVLNEDGSFVYEGGKWKSELRGTVNSPVGDVAGIVAAFLAATPNSKAVNTNGNAQQVLVVQKFTEYMSNYNAWAVAGFPKGSMKNNLQTVQSDMMDAVHGLYFDVSGPKDFIQLTRQDVRDQG